MPGGGSGAIARTSIRPLRSRHDSTACCLRSRSASSRLTSVVHSLPRSVRDQRLRLTLLQDAPLPHDRQSRAQLGHVVDDVGGQDHDDFLADFGEQVLKAPSLGRIEPRGRLVDDQQPRIAEQRLRDAEALFHAAGKAVDAALAGVPEIGPDQQLLHRGCAAAGRAALSARRNGAAWSCAEVRG